MSRSKEANQDIQVQEMLNSKILLVLDSLCDHDAAYGIAKLVLDKGLKSLSFKQNHVFESIILSTIHERFVNCSGCDNEIDLEDQFIDSFEINDNETVHLCPHCKDI